jgi:hypothetical protein
MTKIYKLLYENNPNVIYIGKTERSIDRRYYEHIYEAKNNRRKTKLYNWIRKNGYNDLKIFTICEVEKDKEGFAEIEQIKLHKAKGYILKNHTMGGEGIKKGYKHTDEFCKKAKFKSLLSGQFKGQKNPFFGKYGSKNHKSIQTHQYSLNGNYIKSFESQNLAINEIGLPSDNRLISRACKTGEIAYGYLWSYIKYEKLEPKEYKHKNMSEHDTIMAYKMYQKGLSINKISKEIGYSRGQITKRLKNKYKI